MKDFTTVTDTLVEIKLPNGKVIRIIDKDGGFHISTNMNHTLVVEPASANAILVMPLKRGLRNLPEIV
jgi:hypothetical protein